MNTEKEMKEYFDGWFFTIDHERGRTVTTAVDPKFIPDHKPKYTMDDDDEMPNPNSHRWTEAEEQTLLEMRRTGSTFRQIAKALGLSPSPVQKRYSDLATKLGLSRGMAIRTENLKYSLEMENRIVEMRQAGMGFPEIGKVFGMNRQTANMIYRRYEDRQQRRERVA